MGVEIDGAVQQAPQPGRQGTAAVGVGVDAGMPRLSADENPVRL